MRHETMLRLKHAVVSPFKRQKNLEVCEMSWRNSESDHKIDDSLHVGIHVVTTLYPYDGTIESNYSCHGVSGAMVLNVVTLRSSVLVP